MELELATSEDIITEFVRRGDPALLIVWSNKGDGKVEVKMTAVTDKNKVAVALAKIAKQLAPDVIDLK